MDDLTEALDNLSSKIENEHFDYAILNYFDEELFAGSKLVDLVERYRKARQKLLDALIKEFGEHSVETNLDEDS